MVITTIPLDVTPRLETASRQLAALAAEVGHLPRGMVPSDAAERARLGQHAEDLIARLGGVADDLRQVVRTLAAMEELDQTHHRPRAALRLVSQPGVAVDGAHRPWPPVVTR